MLQASGQTLDKSLKMQPHVAHFLAELSNSHKWMRLMHSGHLSVPAEQSELKMLHENWETLLKSYQYKSSQQWSSLVNNAKKTRDNFGEDPNLFQKVI